MPRNVAAAAPLSVIMASGRDGGFVPEDEAPGRDFQTGMQVRLRLPRAAIACAASLLEIAVISG